MADAWAGPFSPSFSARGMPVLPANYRNLPFFPPPKPPLFVACEKGDVDLVKRLLDQGADIHHTCDNDWEKTPLIVAAWNGHIGVAATLLAANADPNYGRDSGKTALFYACSAGHSDVVRLLIENGADFRRAGPRLASPFEAACGAGDMEIVQLLFDAGEPVDPPPREAWGTGPTSALFCAIKSGHENIVKFLLDKGADVSIASKDNSRLTSNLHAATLTHYNPSEPGYEHALSHHTKVTRHKDEVREHIVRMLLDSDANPDDPAAIEHAARLRQANVLNMPLESNSDAITGKWLGNSISLCAAVQSGDAEILNRLLAAGANIDERNDNADTPLTLATALGHEHLVIKLLYAGAAVDNPGRQDNTALQLATIAGNVALVRLLLAAGADVNVQGGDPSPPLLAAAFCGRPDIATLLLDAGADVNCSGRAVSALSTAARQGHSDIVEILLARGATVKAEDG